ncbi:unnamed protein product, partial [Nesidiocoris tenuis]
MGISFKIVILFTSRIFVVLFVGAARGCSRLEACNSEYATGLELAGIDGPESSAEYCAELRAYGQCIKKATRACRGDLGYHSSSSLIETLIRRHRCAQFRPGPAYRRTSAAGKGKQHQLGACNHRSNGEYLHCGIFGDPHLKTFTRAYQTCSARGAWPLIDNKFLAIQVTNNPVINSSTATVTTKVTIIIRSIPGCAEEKTYEATSDAPLRPLFVDGTSTTGPDGSVQINATNDKTVKIEIYLRYIDTTLIVRKVGSYLGFSCRLPKEVAETKDENSVELCQTGCPATELLDIGLGRGHRASWEAAYSKCKDQDDQIVDQDGGVDEDSTMLTDQYLDWCVFDVMTTGKTDFVETARLAEADVRLLDPHSLQNRTFPLDLRNINANVVQQSSSSPRMLDGRTTAALLILFFKMAAIHLTALRQPWHSDRRGGGGGGRRKRRRRREIGFIIYNLVRISE